MLTVLHIILLHVDGSTNPLGVESSFDYLRFYPKFIIKDIFGAIVFLGPLLGLTVLAYPNALGHPDNYIKANPLVTPRHIVPEWYFLPFYAILRAVPNKLLGVIAMFFSILILFLLPFLGVFKCKSLKFSKMGQFFFWCFISNFLLLGWLGSCVVAQPYIFITRICVLFYFSYFLCITPILSYIDYKVLDFKKKKKY
jgi:quinol-cytochrome oxidoreductase complex cytochrome b subunit